MLFNGSIWHTRYLVIVRFYVVTMTDSFAVFRCSEDEFEMPRLSAHAQREITQQLIKDGYNLDLDPDDEDLDLIPPRPVSERCICCHTQINCTIQ